MSDAVRVSATEARASVKSGNALLVCAYDSEGKFLANRLEGGIALAEFKTRLPGLSKDTELVFYCG